MYFSHTYPYPAEHFDVLVFRPQPGSKWIVKVQLRDENDGFIGGLVSDVDNTGANNSYNTEENAREAGEQLARGMIRS